MGPIHLQPSARCSWPQPGASQNYRRFPLEPGNGWHTHTSATNGEKEIHHTVSMYTCLEQSAISLIPWTSIKLMLESNTNFVLFVLVLSLLLVLSMFPIYSRFTHPLGNSDLLQTSAYCAFHLSTLSHTVNALSLTLVQHSGTHFQKTSDFLSQFLPLDHPAVGSCGHRN